MYLPARFAAVILTFIPVFRQQRTWRHAELLLIAAILAPGRRTITSLLRIAGLSRERRFTTYPSGAQPGRLGSPCGSSSAVGPADRCLCPERPGGAGHRRYDRATP